MSKLYLIGVGGTGARVMHSLMMLLSSGMKINASEIVPMLIDTDVNNGNLTDYKKAAGHYSRIHELTFGGTQAKKTQQFFQTRVRESVDISIDGRQFDNLSDLIDYNGILNENIRKFVDLFFSKDNLEMPLEKGFIGNPNVGTVVLNEIINQSPDFLKFTQEFAEGDRIFVISSIFGGTGAAGFPLLLNNFRHNQKIENAQKIQDAIIGAVTLLPYFSVTKQTALEDADLENYEVDSNAFLLKSKAALSYYDQYVTEDLNGMYFVADYKRSVYPNQKGGKKQKNPANFMELVAALSVFDFMNLESDKNKQSELTRKKNFAEFAIKDDVDQINFSHLERKNWFSKPLIKNHLFRIYLDTFLKQDLDKRNMRWKVDLQLSHEFYTSEEGLCNELKSFYAAYDNWVTELAKDNHARQYIPFRAQQPTEKNVLTLFNGVMPKMKRRLIRGEVTPSLDYSLFFNQHSGTIHEGNGAQKFMTLMNTGIDEIFDEFFTPTN